MGLKAGLLTLVLSYYPSRCGHSRLWGQIYSGKDPRPPLVTQNQEASVLLDNTILSLTSFPSCGFPSSADVALWGLAWVWLLFPHRSTPFSLSSTVGKSERSQANPAHHSRCAGDSHFFLGRKGRLATEAVPAFSPITHASLEPDLAPMPPRRFR